MRRVPFFLQLKACFLYPPARWRGCYTTRVNERTSTMADRSEQIQTLANGAADAFLLGQNFYDLVIEAASEAFAQAQGGAHEFKGLELTLDDRRAFIHAFLRGVIDAVEREYDQLPAVMPTGD